MAHRNEKNGEYTRHGTERVKKRFFGYKWKKAYFWARNDIFEKKYDKSFNNM